MTNTPNQCSLDAAKSVEPDTNKQRLRIHNFLFSWFKVRGATDEELQDLLQMNPNTERPRRVELVRMGLVRDSGLTRTTRSGRKATVWVAV